MTGTAHTVPVSVVWLIRRGGGVGCGLRQGLLDGPVDSNGDLAARMNFIVSFNWRYLIYQIGPF